MVHARFCGLWRLKYMPQLCHIMEKPRKPTATFVPQFETSENVIGCQKHFVIWKGSGTCKNLRRYCSSCGKNAVNPKYFVWSGFVLKFSNRKETLGLVTPMCGRVWGMVNLTRCCLDEKRQKENCGIQLIWSWGFRKFCCREAAEGRCDLWGMPGFSWCFIGV